MITVVSIDKSKRRFFRDEKGRWVCKECGYVLCNLTLGLARPEIASHVCKIKTCKVSGRVL